MTAMTLIQHAEVPSGGLAEIEFATISQEYTDLMLVCSVRNNTRNSPNGGFAYRVLFNSATANQTFRSLRGNGSSTLSQTDANILFIGGGSNEAFGNSSIYIANYTSNTYKPVSVDGVSETNAADTYQYIFAGLWSDNSPITNIKLQGLFGDTLVQYSSATLYGITAGSDGVTTVS